MRIGLVGCVKSKKRSAAPAKDLYTSTLFRGRREYVERTCDRWFVLSAKHGLLDPGTVIKPYDVRLADATAKEKQAWSRRVVEALVKRLRDLRNLTFEIHAGAAYRNTGVTAGLQARGARVENPTAGLNQGRQLAFYRGSLRLERSETKLPRRHSRPSPEVDLSRKELSNDDRVRLKLGAITEIGLYRYQWPSGNVENFDRCWEFDVWQAGKRFRIRHAIGRRNCFGRERVHSVTFVDRWPAVEGAETEDYIRSRALASILKQDDRAMVRPGGPIPPGYASFKLVVHREEVVGPWTRDGVAVKIREDDLAGWTMHAILRVLQRRKSVLEPPQTYTPRPKEATLPPPREIDTSSVVAAILAFGREQIARRDSGLPQFTRNRDANHFFCTDPFAFLVAVICDQGIRAERAWEAPYFLSKRLGHWDLRRIATERDAVQAAVQQRPALQRMVNVVPSWICKAAERVLTEYGGSAANIWSDRPSARQLTERLIAFSGIGQKKAAMAVEILERDLRVSLREMSGSDIAYDVHVRRVFLRTGLANRDDRQHMITVARRAHVDRPGALDYPAWEIGRRWCRPRDPECEACPLSSVCPRLVAQGDGVTGM